jgi:hypothetical protein
VEGAENRGDNKNDSSYFCKELQHDIKDEATSQTRDGVRALTPKEGYAMPAAQKLVRKQFLISPSQAKKIELMAKKQKTSAAEMVRKAIDAFNPDALADMAETELLELVRVRVKEAITDTRKTREQLVASLNTLVAKEG